MFSYTKSMLAVGLALVAVVCAGLWFQSRMSALEELTRRRDDLRAQMAGVHAYPALIADYEQRQAGLDRDIVALTRKFIASDDQSSILVKAVVKSASIAGMEMTNASKQEQKTSSLNVRGQGQKAGVISHEITIKGSYTALVKFMQSLNTWTMGYRLESIEIVPLKEGAEDGQVEVTIILSVFSLEQISGA